MICTKGRGGMRSVVEGYRENGLFDEWDIRTLDTHDEGGFIRWIPIFAAALSRLASNLLLGRVQAVHCHVAAKGSFWRKSICASMARAAGVPTILHIHGSEMKDFIGAQPRWRLRLIRAQLRKASAVVVLSPSWQQYFKGIEPAAKIHVIPNGVALPPRRIFAASSDSAINVLFLGEIGERKGIFDLLRAFKQARRLCPALRLFVGGKGELQKARDLVRELDLVDTVEFCGWVVGETKQELLRRADIYVLPSYNEGLPMSLLEAMSWSVPVISTTVGGIPELVSNGRHGFLINAGDIAGMATMLAKLGNDPQLRRSMGEQARARVEQDFSSAAVRRKLAALYGGISLSRPKEIA